MRASHLLVAGTLTTLLVAGCGLSESPTPEDPPAPGNEPTAPPPPANPNPTTPPNPGTTPPAPTPPATGANPTPPPPGTMSPPIDPPGPSNPPPAPAQPSPTPPGAAGVTINGTFIPKDKVIVTLHLGHSNAAGRTDVPASMRSLYFQTNPKLWAYAKGGRFVAAKEPLSGDRLTQGKAGPGMAILHTAREHAPDLTFVHIGRGHDGSVGGFCRNFRKGALLYPFVMDAAAELKGKVTFGGIFVMLGVNEFRRDRMNIPRFFECLAGIANDMRTDLGDPNIPFLMGDWEAGATGDFDPETQPTAPTIKEQLRRAADTVIPRAGLIPSEGLPMSDDHHYNLVGYKLWAERGFQIMRMKELVPWATTVPESTATVP